MAGIGGDNTTSEWRWMIEEREFVAALLRQSDAMADKVLRDALDDDAIRWRCRELVTEWNNLKPDIAAELVGMHRIFWRRQAHTTIDVDYPNHHAIRIGPPWFFRHGLPISMKELGGDLDIEAANFLYDEGPVFLPDKPKIKLTAYLIKFHHEDVVRRCRELGLLPAAPQVAPPEPVPSAPVIAETPAALTPRWDPQSEWSIETVMLNLEIDERAWAQRAIIEAMPRLLGLSKNKGRSIPKILDTIRAAALHRDIEAGGGNTSRDSCEKFLGAWKAWRAKH
jgi:hypothetical protein